MFECILRLVFRNIYSSKHFLHYLTQYEVFKKFSYDISKANDLPSGRKERLLLYSLELPRRFRERKTKWVPTSLSVKANSVIHYHANIHKALKYAVKIDLLDSNPADKVECPKKDPFMGSFYDSDEVEKLFETAKGTVLEIPVFPGAFYGLRRRKVRQKRKVYKRHKSACRLIFLAQREGFEPSWDCSQTDFESAPL